MLFHTWPFLVFFAVVMAVYLPIRRFDRARNLWLLAASYFFYGYWNPLFLVLIVYSTLLDYWVVLAMERRGRSRGWLVVSIVNNLWLLGLFKYGDFVVENLNAGLAAVSAGYQLPEMGLLLPVGISFFTFQSMSYTIDYYRGQLKAEHDVVRFAAFVSLFPQLVAGPIERARNLLPQLTGTPDIRRRDVTSGASLFLVGLFKKVALADFLGAYVTPMYNAPEDYSGLALVLGTFAFGWQIYFDFSGYTDMARGVAKAMGFNLMLNFRNPYTATSLGDFWSRWHISLSTWFKEYVYIPLGGNRTSKLLAWMHSDHLKKHLGTYLNMLVTMLVSGLWHGANWAFVAWGALHAGGSMTTRELERSRLYRDRVPKLVKQLAVFAFVTFTWIFFRAGTAGGPSTAVTVIGRIFSPSSWRLPTVDYTQGASMIGHAATWLTTVLNPASYEVPGTVAGDVPRVLLVMVLAVWAYQLVWESRRRRLVDNAPVKIILAVAMILYLSLVPTAGTQAFIYFQF